MQRLLLAAALALAPVSSAGGEGVCAPRFPDRKGQPPAPAPAGAPLSFCQRRAALSPSPNSSASQRQQHLPSPADSARAARRSYAGSTCCGKRETDAVRASAYFLAQSGASDACVDAWSSLRCSVCDPAGGVVEASQPLASAARPAACAPVCDRLLAACGDAFFAEDKATGLLAPCVEERDPVCARLAAWAPDGAAACDLAGFDRHPVGATAGWCFTGAPPAKPGRGAASKKAPASKAPPKAATTKASSSAASKKAAASAKAAASSSSSAAAAADKAARRRRRGGGGPVALLRSLLEPRALAVAAFASQYPAQFLASYFSAVFCIWYAARVRARHQARAGPGGGGSAEGPRARAARAAAAARAAEARRRAAGGGGGK